MNMFCNGYDGWNTNRSQSLVILAGVMTAGLAGCGLFGPAGGVTERPESLVRFDDPQSDVSLTRIRDFDDDEEQFVTVGSDGSLQYADCSVCEICSVEDAVLTIGDSAIHVRFGPGIADPETRQAYLVSDDCFYIDVTSVGSAVELVKTDEPFEEGDTACAESATVAGTGDNPCLGQE